MTVSQSTTNVAAPRCVIVDDHDALIEAMQRVLTDGGIDVVGYARTAEAALDQLRELEPDIALVDMSLPGGMDGLRMTAIARDEGLPTRIVIFTSSDAPTHVMRAFECGAHGYLTKMNRSPVIVDSLRTVATGRRFIDPALAMDVISPDGNALSSRELEILELVGTGMQNDGIGYELDISPETVKTHVSRVLSKLSVTSRTQAVAHALRTGLID